METDYCRGLYAKGPVLANKAERTQRYYAAKARKEGLKRTTLTGFIRPISTITAETKPPFDASPSDCHPEDLNQALLVYTSPLIGTSNEPPQYAPSGPNKRRRAAHVMGLSVALSECGPILEGKRQRTAPAAPSCDLSEGDIEEGVIEDEDDIGDEEIEELMSDVVLSMPLQPKPKSWMELRDKVDGILSEQRKKKAISMPLAQVGWFWVGAMDYWTHAHITSS